MKKREKLKLFLKKISNKKNLINKINFNKLIEKGNFKLEIPFKDTLANFKSNSLLKDKSLIFSKIKSKLNILTDKKYFSNYQKKIKRLKISGLLNSTKKSKNTNINQKKTNRNQKKASINLQRINLKNLFSFQLNQTNNQFELIKKKFKLAISKTRFNNDLKELVIKYFPKTENKANKSTNFFVVVHYSEHKLSISKILFDKKIFSVEDLISINIPTAIVGDFKVENKSDLLNILGDIFSLFDITNKPVMLLLGSSFFTIKSFDDSELVSFSEDNPQLLSKSPFLPDDTLIQYSRSSGNKLTSYHRVVYSNKKVMDTWIEVLSDLGQPLVGVTCSCIHLIEEITKKFKKLSILCDVDMGSTYIYIEKENCELNTFKLPFGASNYISTDKKISEQFFERLGNSISSIVEKFGYPTTNQIFLIGEGIDKLEIENLDLDQKFKKFPDEIFMNYKVNKNIDKSIVLENKSNLIKMTSVTEIINKWLNITFYLITKELKLGKKD